MKSGPSILQEKNLLAAEDWEKTFGVKFHTEREKARFNDSLHFLRLLPAGEGRRVFDYGSGPGHHALVLKTLGYNAICIDFQKPVHTDLEWHHPDEMPSLSQADAIWSHHCLEHIPNPIEMLIKWRDCLVDGGELFLTLPPPIIENVVGGHITSHSAALLLYHLVIAGFDCSESKFCAGKVYPNDDNHLRAWVRKSKDWHPAMFCPKDIHWDLLIKRNLFPKEVADRIKETGNYFSSYNIISRWPSYEGVTLSEQCHSHYKPAPKKPTFVQKIFSIMNEYDHKVVRLMGIKVKLHLGYKKGF